LAPLLVVVTAQYQLGRLNVPRTPFTVR